MRTLLILISNFTYSLMASVYYFKFHWGLEFNSISVLGPVISLALFFFWIRLLIKGSSHNQLYSSKAMMMVRLAMFADILWQGALFYIYFFRRTNKEERLSKDAIYDYAYYIAIAG